MDNWPWPHSWHSGYRWKGTYPVHAQSWVLQRIFVMEGLPTKRERGDKIYKLDDSSKESESFIASIVGEQEEYHLNKANTSIHHQVHVVSKVLFCLPIFSALIKSEDA